MSGVGWITGGCDRIIKTRKEVTNTAKEELTPWQIVEKKQRFVAALSCI